jgi:uncharacterized protein YjdB
MSIKTLCFRSLLLLFVLTAVSQAVLGQGLGTCEEVKASKDFYILGTKIGELNSEIRQLEEELQQQQARTPDATSDAEIAKEKDEIKRIEDLKNQTPADQARLRFLELKVQSQTSLESLNKKIAEIKSELVLKKTLVRCIQNRLSTIFSPEQDFKFWMSVFFALLIGLVIIGFFWLSLKDAIMRRAIFSGQTGIQFLTLFSIVIAIILFGITGILEDKELAALIGGISGYILGRYSSASPPSASLTDRLSSISVSPDTVSLSTGSPSAQLRAIPKDQSGNEIKDVDNEFKPKWESNNAAIATVDQTGKVTRVATGTCSVTASFKTITSTPCTVTCGP